MLYYSLKIAFQDPSLYFMALTILSVPYSTVFTESCVIPVVYYQAPMDNVKPVATQKVQVKNQWIMTQNKKA